MHILSKILPIKALPFVQWSRHDEPVRSDGYIFFFTHHILVLPSDMNLIGSLLIVFFFCYSKNKPLNVRRCAIITAWAKPELAILAAPHANFFFISSYLFLNIRGNRDLARIYSLNCSWTRLQGPSNRGVWGIVAPNPQDCHCSRFRCCYIYKSITRLQAFPEWRRPFRKGLRQLYLFLLMSVVLHRAPSFFVFVSSLIPAVFCPSTLCPSFDKVASCRFAEPINTRRASTATQQLHFCPRHKRGRDIEAKLTSQNASLYQVTFIGF